MTRTPLRYMIPVNDAPHEFPAGKVLHLSQQRGRSGPEHLVEVWIEVEIPVSDLQTVQVVGTGHPIPDGAEHLATCLDGSLVWHLYRLAEESS